MSRVLKIIKGMNKLDRLWYVFPIIVLRMLESIATLIGIIGPGFVISNPYTNSAKDQNTNDQ